LHNVNYGKAAAHDLVATANDLVATANDLVAAANDLVAAAHHFGLGYRAEKVTSSIFLLIQRM